MDFLKGEIEFLKKEGLYRALKTLESPQGPTILLEGKRLLQLSSNNYLGLANHPRLKAAVVDALEKYGIGAGGSRLVGSNFELNSILEGKLARLKGKESALLFSTGYMANVGILSSLVGEGDVIVSDELNHASIIDGCRMSRAETRVFLHKDMNDLEALLKKLRHQRRKLIVTDGVFSMDGDIAPLPDIVELAEKYGCMVMVDDAHATGVLGNTGGGTAEHFGLEPRVDIIMGTLGKALGGFGAFIAGEQKLKEYLVNRARPFIFTTALPVPVLASGIAALEVLEEEPELRVKLWENVGFFRKGVASLGFDIGTSETPIIPLMVGEASLTMDMTELLIEEGVFIQGIRPPAVPAGTSRLRITLMATHTRAQLEYVLEVLEKAGRTLGLLAG